MRNDIVLLNAFDKLFSRKIVTYITVTYCALKIYQNLPYTKFFTYFLLIYVIIYGAYNIIRDPKCLLFCNSAFVFLYFLVCIISFAYNGIGDIETLPRIVSDYFVIYCSLILYMPRKYNDTNYTLADDFKKLMKI